MPKTAADIMHRDFFYASQADSILEVLHAMTDRGLGSAPVLDLQGHPLGVATLRDIESCHRPEELTEHLTRSGLTISQDASIEAAARELAKNKADTVVLVDEHGVAVGLLSALDVLRALFGYSEGEPAAEEALAPRSGVWSAGARLEVDAAHRAPSAPGVLLLGKSADVDGERAVWVEPCDDVRERLDHMLRMPQDDARLEALLAEYPRTLYFRVLVLHDAERRERLARAIANLIQRAARAS